MAQTAIVAGVGPGLGAAIVRRFVRGGCNVGMFARSSQTLESLESELGDRAIGIRTDITDHDEVAAGVDAVRDAFGPIDVLVMNASGGAWKGVNAISPEEFESAWRVSAFGALGCVQAVIGDMLDGGTGTILFTGATSALRGRDGAIGFSAAKFAARGMAESMARELGPEGIHVAHVVIDGQILPDDSTARYPNRGEETFLDPDAIAETYWALVQQDRSAWTLELDVRPHVESF